MKRNNLMALIILIFVLLSVAGNLFVWLKITGSIPAARIISGDVNLCFDVLPTLHSIGNLNVTVQTLFTYQVNATSNAAASVYYYAITTPNLASFSMDSDSGLISFTAAESEVGTYSIYFWITHGVCGNQFNDSETITLNVKTANQPPYWVNLTAAFTLTEDALFSVNLSQNATDPNNDSIIFSHNSTSASFPSFSITSRGLVSFTANDSDVGFHRVNITISDIYDAKNSSIFNFTVQNVNDAPILDIIPDQEACEDAAFYYDVNATDDDLLIPNSIEVLHFYDNTSLFVINEDTGEISFTPDYSQAGMHNIRISVSDEEAADYYGMYLDIIEVNDAPVLSSIGAQTVYTNDSFDYYASATDEEEGSPPSTLVFNLSFLNGTQFFDINPATGRMNFTANASINGTYSIRVCINDSALASPHANATSVCNDGNIKSDCETFSLTITAENRAPQITSYYPVELNQTIYEAQSITFNVSAIDLDGTITTIYWYKNGSFAEIINDIAGSLVQTTNALSDSYQFTTDYSSAGNYTIFINVSDGRLFDSVSWNITVLDRAPPAAPTAPAAGAPGGGGVFCREIWGCTDWSICQNASTPESRLMTGRQYSDILESCSAGEIPEERCGFQMRTCAQTSKCNTQLKKPSELQVCYFTLMANCFDSIRNCHGPFVLCEVLVDCGGPCPPCPSCSDRIQNQGEEWIDCGGPCPPCPMEYPKPPKCGDKRCEISEIFTCMEDCGLFWRIIFILVFILIVLAGITRREFIKKKSAEKEKELKKKRAYLHNLINLVKKAIAERDVTLARHYYNVTKRMFESLPANEKKRIYGRIMKLFSEVDKLP